MLKKRELASAHVRIKRLINAGGTNTNGVISSSSSTEGNPKNLLSAKGQIGKLVKLNYEYIDRIEQLQNDYILEKAKSDSTSYLASELKNINDSLKIDNLILKDKLSKSNVIRISRLNVYTIREKMVFKKLSVKQKNTEAKD